MQLNLSDPPNETDLQEFLMEEIFHDNYGRPRKTPVHTGQLRVLLEDKWNPWQVDAALRTLTSCGAISALQQAARNTGEMTFYYPSEVKNQTKQPTLIASHARSLSKLVNLYLSPRVTSALGKHLEGLAKYELKVKGFEIVGESTRGYNGMSWTKTRDNLDIVAVHRSKGLAVGVEVKNTLDLIERREVQLKIEMCEHLGLTPLFAVRWIGPRAGLVMKHDGIIWEFKTQVYPPGFESLVEEIVHRFSLAWNETQGKYLYPMPVEVRTDLPMGTYSIPQASISR
jgi:hypothetical protein